MYVLIHNETNKYVGKPGADKSYTNKLEEARIFPTVSEAEAERCVESERIVPLRQVLSMP